MQIRIRINASKGAIGVNDRNHKSECKLGTALMQLRLFYLCPDEKKIAANIEFQ